MKCQQTPQIVRSRKRGLLVYKTKKDVILSQKHSHDNNNGFIVSDSNFWQVWIWWDAAPEEQRRDLRPVNVANNQIRTFEQALPQNLMRSLCRQRCRRHWHVLSDAQMMQTSGCSLVFETRPSLLTKGCYANDLRRSSSEVLWLRSYRNRGSTDVTTKSATCRLSCLTLYKNPPARVFHHTPATTWSTRELCKQT